MTINEIPLSAQEVLQNYWDGSIPINPARIAKKLGVNVIVDDSLSDIEGQFAYEDDIPTIRVASSDHPARMRFTVAHELGHYCLCHNEGARDPYHNFSGDVRSYKERAANQFASALLMPEYLVKRAVREFEITDVQELADAFNVSGPAMRIRLKELGMIR